jgi:metal-responsive CopG/Arc/MetJ family transcriptional regulator
MASATRAPRSAPGRRAARKPAKERVLIEFPTAALRRADEAARAQGVSRSEFIRAAVERQLEARDAEEFERELEQAYKVNAAFNLQILREFEHVDREAWEKIP